MAGREEGTKVWVGGLPDDAEKEELDRAFSEFGRLNNVWVARRPPGFAFVFFEDQRDAQDAVDKMDGSELFGRRIKVEISHGGRRGGGRRDFDRRGGYDDRDRYRDDRYGDRFDDRDSYRRRDDYDRRDRYDDRRRDDRYDDRRDDRRDDRYDDRRDDRVEDRRDDRDTRRDDRDGRDSRGDDDRDRRD
eukprot:TRINITY_DN11220_c0_g1_i7.p1 TRINITY_DN11220_c0_g1~~TRINITY_DN11220_c0_g1_i7.p1  ORF type:complete len:189 (+),score=23.18 TRINITY_DN11220_c0_g1_i7:93-659(+)